MNVDPIFARQDPFRDINPPSYALPTSGLQSLPKPPPRKRPSAWDRDNISETLAGIGAGFLSSRNFGEGMGAAAQSLTVRNRQLREAQRPDISYGGPNDQFEITTDRQTGAKSIREVPEFRAANERALAAKNRPDFKTQQDMRSRALFAIATQIPPEQRGEAYRDLMANPDRYGVDTSGMPAEWDERFGTIAGTMGLSVNDGLTQKRNDANFEDTMRHRRVLEGQGDRRVQQGDARFREGQRHNAVTEEQGAQNLRRPPASVRSRKPRSATLTSGTAMNGYVYQGGDPANRNNWKKQ